MQRTTEPIFYQENKKNVCQWQWHKCLHDQQHFPRNKLEKQEYVRMKCSWGLR